MAAGVMVKRNEEMENGEAGRQKKVGKKKTKKQNAGEVGSREAKCTDDATEIGEIKPLEAMDAGGKKRKVPEAENGDGDAQTKEKKKTKKKDKNSAAGEGRDSKEKSKDDAQGLRDAPDNGSQAERQKGKKKDKKEKRDKANLRGTSEAISSFPSEATACAAPAATATTAAAPAAAAWTDVPVRVEGILPRADSAGDVTSVAAGECPLLGGWLRPLSSFSEVSDRLDGRLMEAFAGFAHPSPVQRWAWPVLLHGSDGGKDERRDLIAIAATGSGKTLAFGLPGLMRILAGKKIKGGEKGRKEKGEDVCQPGMLVLAPTRELAQQVSGEAK